MNDGAREWASARVKAASASAGRARATATWALRRSSEARRPARPSLALPPLLDGLVDLGVDHHFEIVHALTPWLADRTDGAGPQALAALAVPSLSKRADQPMSSRANIISS